jgi:hypothetical protein
MPDSRKNALQENLLKDNLMKNQGDYYAIFLRHRDR